MALDSEPVARLYKDAYRQFGRSPASVLCPKGRQRNRYRAMLSGIDLAGKRILDFGCGLAHLSEYLDEEGIVCDYTGADLVEEFIADDRRTMPHRTFQLIRSIADLTPDYDVILSSGVFNLAYLDDWSANKTAVFAEVEQLFELTQGHLCVDFLSSLVDFQSAGAFHVPPETVLQFALSRLSRRSRVDHSYLPYEFCLTVSKADEIDRARGMYDVG